MASTGAMQETYNGYDNSSYMGVYPQQWQEQWNWGTDTAEYSTGEQFCGNVAFFVPFPGMVGGVPMTNNTTTENLETPQTNKAEVHEMEAKMAKLQAENQRLMQLCENERQMRQIEVSAKQQILEMYAVPRSEVEQLVRRFQEDSPTAMQQMHYGETTTPYVSASNASTTAGSPGTSSATSLETLLQDLYKKLYEPEDQDERYERDGEGSGRTSRESKDWGNEVGAESHQIQVTPEEEEELQHHLSHLQNLAGMEIDDRAKGSLLRMSPGQGKVALRKVEDIIHEQGGFCHNLSSMVQSVCRKMSHVSRQWA
mmetsp:Transcript_95986/g.117625  ORF Transcript_95986/g.117625 Transcript_95986/m.117625 type:complete len:312 (+) Transcript_95986:65-1000(+)